MGQRLGIAAALLGDPETVILDEPSNGLDPEGIQWVRNLLKSLAAEGRTVFVSSHLMSEMALTADHLIVIGRGRLIVDGSVAELIGAASKDVVRVRTPETRRLGELLSRQGVAFVPLGPDTFEVRGLAVEAIGELAFAGAIPIHELTPLKATLEDAFMELTHEDVEFMSRSTADAVRDAA